MKNSVHASAIFSVLERYVREGHSVSKLFKALDLPPLLLVKHDARFPTDKVGQLFSLIRQALNDESLGYLENKTPPGTFELSLNACINTKTLGEALSKYFFFWKLVHKDFSCELKTEGELSKIRLIARRPELDSGLFTTHVMLLLLRFASWLTNRLLIIDRLTLSCPEPVFSEDYTELFPCQVLFAHIENSITFHRSFLDFPVVRSPSEIPQFIYIAENVMTQKGVDRSLTGEIKRMFIFGDDLHSIMLKTVAERLNLSETTIHRRLKKEGNSFAEIKESIRRDRATHYLEATDMTINRISELVGFSEPATFNRAFKSWSGLTPGEYRESHNKRMKK